jgi:hypothetical protein
MEQQHVLELLGAALASVDGDFNLRNRVERVKGDALPVVLSELSLLEREATDVTIVRLIATAKQVLVGKGASDAFVKLCNGVAGL